jgi:ABC-2 type transport system ATP-binding protein
MDEAEELCDRIAVFRAGRIVATDTPSALVARYADHSTVQFTWMGDDLPWLSCCPGTTDVFREGTRFSVKGEGPLLAHVGAALVAHGIAPLDLRGERATLEDAFLRMSEISEGDH